MARSAGPDPTPGGSSTGGRDPGRPGRLRSPAWLIGGASGATLFVVVFVLVSLLHPPGYDPLQHTVSGFVLGDFGWVQRANFLVSGSLLALSAPALHVVWARHGGGRVVPALVALLGLGLVGAGLFAADPLAAGVTSTAPYPSGEPVATARTLHGILHDLFGIPVFLGLPILAAAAGYRLARARRFGWAGYSVATAALFLAGFVLTGLALAQPPVIPPVGGLLQRLTLATGLIWLTALMLRLWRDWTPPQVLHSRA